MTMSKSRAISLAVTAVLVAATASLLVLRGCRAKLVDTPFGAVKLNKQPAADERPFAVAEEWPRWRGPRGDGVSREAAGDAWPAKGLKLLWDQRVGLGFSSPVAAGGRVYLFSMRDGRQDVLTCFDARSGEQIWESASDAGAVNDFPGTRATPTIVGDSIYTYGGSGELLCRHVADGAIRWKQNAIALAGGNQSPKWGTASSPLVEDGKVFVQTGQGGSVAVALAADTGALAWKSEATGGGSYAAPIWIKVDGTPQLVVFAASAVYGMAPDTGKTLWRQPWNTQYGVNATTPVYRAPHLFVSSEYGMGGMMLKLSPAGVEKLWEKRQIKNKFNGMVLEGDTLYGNSGGGQLVGLSWPDGEPRWKSDDSALNIGDGGSFVRAAGDKIVLMSQTGKLTLARMTPQGPVAISQFEPFQDIDESDTQVWSTPLLYGGRIYVKGAKRLLCFELPS